MPMNVVIEPEVKHEKHQLFVSTASSVTATQY